MCCGGCHARGSLCAALRYHAPNPNVAYGWVSAGLIISCEPVLSATGNRFRSMSGTARASCEPQVERSCRRQCCGKIAVPSVLAGHYQIACRPLGPFVQSSNCSLLVLVMREVLEGSNVDDVLNFHNKAGWARSCPPRVGHITFVAICRLLLLTLWKGAMI